MGYILLTVLSILVMFTTPFCAFSTNASKENDASSSEPVSTQTVQTQKAVFKVKNTQTGDVITMDEQSFLIGIVTCEMSPLAPTEALKAQAVAAYTYYCKQRNAAEDGIFSNVPDTFFTYGTKEGLQQRFGDNFTQYYATISSAVQAVEGKRILYDGEPITACYHAISAGLTEHATDVWGGDYPYLTPVDSFGDLQADAYETTATFTVAELEALLEAHNPQFTVSGDADTWFGTPDTTDSGFVKTVEICGTIFKGTDVRTALSLRSACFTVAYKEETFQFTVRGYGHNVGMSQTGAIYMANNGADYREILLHYYPNTVLADK